MSIVPATLCVTTTAASVKELDKNIDRLVINYMADLEDDREIWLKKKFINGRLSGRM